MYLWDYYFDCFALTFFFKYLKDSCVWALTQDLNRSFNVECYRVVFSAFVVGNACEHSLNQGNYLTALSWSVLFSARVF